MIYIHTDLIVSIIVNIFILHLKGCFSVEIPKLALFYSKTNTIVVVKKKKKTL